MNPKLKELIESKHNIILSGAAGVGKSYQVRKIIETYGDSKKIALTSTTGIAAANIGGQTLHSFLNLGMIKTDDIQREVARIVYNPWAQWQEVKKTNILIIDEISMCDGFLFNIVEEVLRKIRENSEPFGGVQVILVGDCYQLPPVEANTKGFFFESSAFAFGNFKPVILTKVYRQNDKKFIDCLNRIRIAEHKKEDIEYLQKRQFPKLNYALLDTTCLYPTNKEADLLNEYRLNDLEGEEFCFKSKDTDYTDPTLTGFKRDFNKFMRAPENLKLKSGARVILLNNINVKKGLCNGATGIFKRKKGDLLVCEFNSEEEFIEKSKFEVHEKGKLVFERKQYPLALGWAVSIHKCVAKDTFMYYNNQYNTIENISINDICKNGKCGEDKVINKSNLLIKDGYKITTKCGYELICSNEHPILINDEKNQYFKKLKDITNEDYICIDRSIINNDNIYNFIQTKKEDTEILTLNLPKKMTNDFAWMLGYIVGDGSYNDKKDGRIKITTNDIEVLNKIEKIFKNIGLNTKIRQKKNTKCYNLYIHSKQFRRFLYINGLDYVIHENKKIPECILKSSQKHIAEFIKGLFDADGSASQNKIRFVSKSKNLINEIKILLLGFGIITYELKTTNNNICMHLLSSSINNYYKYIGFSIKYKQDLLKKYLENFNCKTNKDIIPNGKIIIDDIKKYIQESKKNTKGKLNQGLYSAKYNKAKVKHIFAHKFSYVNYFHFDYIKNILEQEQLDYKNTTFGDRINKHYFYDKVAKIENLNKKIEMYDIEVENSNSFFANGFVAHNSQGMSLDSVAIDFARIFAPHQAYVALSRARSYDGLYLKNLKNESIFIDNKVIKFMESLKK